MKEAAEERRRRNRTRVGGGGARRSQGETRSDRVRWNEDTSTRSLLSLHLRVYDRGEVAVRPKRRLCTTSGAREGSFGRFGEGHGGVAESGRGVQGGMPYRIVASRSSHVQATATPRDRRRNRTATLRLCVHSCGTVVPFLSLSFFPFFSSPPPPPPLLYVFCSFSSPDITLLVPYLIMLAVKYDDIGDRKVSSRLSPALRSTP